jgi:hypothetical protein
MPDAAANIAPNDFCLENDIRIALAKKLKIPTKNLLIPLNRDKYHDPVKPTASDAPLFEVFNIMKSLNESALNDPFLGVDNHGDNSFGTTFDDITKDIISYFGQKPFTYLELGPEPAKTHRLISSLQQAGCRITKYVSVDINPCSAPIMQKAIGSLLPPSKVHCITKSFENVNREEIGVDDEPIFTTMLGFQEGNEHPDNTHAFLNRILRDGDCVLSEMQISDGNNDKLMKDFYLDPRIRRFSKLALERMFPNAKSTYRLEIIPVHLDNEEMVRACISCEDIYSPDSLQNHTFVSNYCLKFTPRQFRCIRTRNGAFKILSEKYIGDKSVLFQLSRKQFA